MVFSFPSIYKLYLKAMNGTAKDTINIYGRSGEPERYAPGFYSYPKDLPKMREMIGWIYEKCTVTPADVEARQIPHIMPIVEHRVLVADRCGTNPVLSMYGDDIIPYAPDLMAFLVYEYLPRSCRGAGHTQRSRRDVLAGRSQVILWTKRGQDF